MACDVSHSTARSFRGSTSRLVPPLSIAAMAVVLIVAGKGSNGQAEETGLQRIAADRVRRMERQLADIEKMHRQLLTEAISADAGDDDPDEQELAKNVLVGRRQTRRPAEVFDGMFFGGTGPEMVAATRNSLEAT